MEVSIYVASSPGAVTRGKKKQGARGSMGRERIPFSLQQSDNSRGAALNDPTTQLPVPRLRGRLGQVRCRKASWGCFGGRHLLEFFVALCCLGTRQPYLHHSSRDDKKAIACRTGKARVTRDGIWTRKKYRLHAHHCSCLSAPSHTPNYRPITVLDHHIMHQSVETPAPQPPGQSGGVTGTWPWKYAFGTLHFPGGTGTVTICQICRDFSRDLQRQT